MGGCHCTEGKEDTHEVVTVHQQPVSEHAAPLAPNEPKAQLPIELPQWNTADLSYLQTTIRAYLIRKEQKDALKQVLVLDYEAEDVPEVDIQEERKEIPELLTKEAKEKLERLGPFKRNLKVAGGAMKPPVTLIDGSVFVGQWLGLKRVGYGRLYQADGGYQEGYWNGVLHVYGRIIQPNGDHYEGEFHMGQMHGYGRFEDLAGVHSYDGQWRDNQKHGQGVEKGDDGATYSGSFETDQKCGRGVMRWSSGESYEGDFHNDTIHGHGKYIWSPTKYYEGQWDNGKMHGQGKFIIEDKEYEGEFFQDKKHGKGIYKWEGNVYEGDFVDNKMHGQGYLSMKGKPRKLYTFANNKRLALVEEPAQPPTSL